MSQTIPVHPRFVHAVFRRSDDKFLWWADKPAEPYLVNYKSIQLTIGAPMAVSTYISKFTDPLGKYWTVTHESFANLTAFNRFLEAAKCKIHTEVTPSVPAAAPPAYVKPKRVGVTIEPEPWAPPEKVA